MIFIRRLYAEFDGVGLYFKGCMNELGMCFSLAWISGVLLILNPFADTRQGMVIDALSRHHTGRIIALVPLVGAIWLAVGMRFGWRRAYGPARSCIWERWFRVGGAIIYGAVFGWITLIVVCEYPTGFYITGPLFWFGPGVALRSGWLGSQGK